jgi:hypothetical protein
MDHLLAMDGPVRRAAISLQVKTKSFFVQLIRNPSLFSALRFAALKPAAQGRNSLLFGAQHL